MPVCDSFSTALLSFWGCFPSQTPFPHPLRTVVVGWLARDFFVPPAASVSPLVPPTREKGRLAKPGHGREGNISATFLFGKESSVFRRAAVRRKCFPIFVSRLFSVCAARFMGKAGSCLDVVSCFQGGGCTRV